MVRILNKMDKLLLVLAIFMFVFGLFMILDASSMRSFLGYGVNTVYFTRQLLILIVSLVIFFIVVSLPLKKYNSLSFVAVVILICLLAFLVISGVATNNSKSWFYIGSFGVQPSEFAKIAIILFSAVYYNMNIKNLDNVAVSVVPLAVGAIFTVLTLLQPDGGTGLILFAISTLLFYASPVTKRVKLKVTFAGLIAAVLILLVVVISGKSPLSSMQRNRFNYLKPCTRYQDETGYQVCNGYIAINNGKIFSIEPGNSKQKYLYLPEAHTDFIFPIIVEEMGLVTGIILILVYMLIIYRIILIGTRSYTLRNSMLCFGVAWYLFLHVTVNLTGVLGLLPLTGVPLPFLSYGGSFALTVAVSLALVERVAVENYDFQKKRVLKN